MLTFKICPLSVYTFSFNLCVVAYLSCVACCPLYKAFFAQLNIQFMNH